MTIEKRILKFKSKTKGIFNARQEMSVELLCSCGNICFGFESFPEYIGADEEPKNTINITCNKCHETSYVSIKNNYGFAFEYELVK